MDWSGRVGRINPSRLPRKGVMTYLLTASLAFAAGWFLSAVAITNGLRADIRRLDAERQELDDEREALHLAWNSAPEPRVTFDLGAHRRLPEVLR